MTGHDYRPVPRWGAARRCARCRLVEATFTADGDYLAWMSGGVLLGDSLDPAGYVAPSCPAPYGPIGERPARRGWGAIYAQAGTYASPTPAQARLLAAALASGGPVTGDGRPQVVARCRTLGWLSRAYRITPAGAAALERARRAPSPIS